MAVTTDTIPAKETSVIAEDSTATSTGIMKMLQEQIEVLAVQVKKLTRPKPSSTANGPNTLRRRRRPQPGDPDYLCYYHWKFGNNAKKCDAHCNFVQQQQPKNE